MEQLVVSLPQGDYPIFVGTDLWQNIVEFSQPFSQILVVTDENVAPLYGEQLPYPTYVLPSGEEHKTPQTAIRLAEDLAAREFDRASLLLALGGGVVGDVTGFAASIYARGISYAQIPTTLLAQVDSSIGGKTGVNLPQGKNLIGTFQQPAAIFVDLTTLTTLPKREITTGLAEVLKYGIIRSRDFFLQVRDQLADFYQLNLGAIKPLILRCCQFKSDIVSQDEKEQGIRKILNHGHTFGHGLEAVTNYQVYTHGEAVLWGMLWEARLSFALGLLSQPELELITRTLQQVPLDWSLPHLNFNQLIQALLRDKKNKAGKIAFILPRRIGEVAEIMLSAEEAAHYLERVLSK